jgi:hypothetical protein
MPTEQMVSEQSGGPPVFFGVWRCYDLIRRVYIANYSKVVRPNPSERESVLCSDAPSAKVECSGLHSGEGVLHCYCRRMMRNVVGTQWTGAHGYINVGIKECTYLNCGITIGPAERMCSIVVQCTCACNFHECAGGRSVVTMSCLTKRMGMVKGALLLRGPTLCTLWSNGFSPPLSGVSFCAHTLWSDHMHSLGPAITYL